MAHYIRARSPQHKQERMESIMEATDELFRSVPYHEISLSVIAKNLGWSRANLYKYVSTKEEIFLSLHSAKNRAWLNDLASALGGVSCSDAEFGLIWAQLTEQHSDFVRYQDILISIIETNVDLDKLVEFKRTFAEMVLPVRGILARQCGLIDEVVASELYFSLVYQATGLYHHFHCADTTKRAMQLAGVPAASGSFAEAYGRFVEMCLNFARTRTELGAVRNSPA